MEGIVQGLQQKAERGIEYLRREYKERSERLAILTAVEKTITARDVPRAQSPMELLTPRELSQTTEERIPTAADRVTFPDPSDTLDDPVAEQAVQKLIKTSGRLFVKRNLTGSGVSAPYGKIDNTGRVELYSEVMTKTGAYAATKPTEFSKYMTRR